MAKSEKTIVAELVQARKDAWEPTIKFFDWAALQHRTPKETNIDDLQRDLKISKTDMYALVSGILEIEIGDRTIGLHGAKSRIHWRYSLPSIARCSRDKTSVLEPLETARFAPATKKVAAVEHVIRLRPDFTVKIALPQDLTAFEVERLKQFIDTCRMEEK